MRKPLFAGFAGMIAVAHFAVAVVTMGIGAHSVSAGPNDDTDSDGVLDGVDNCVTIPNGPLLATLSCDSQEDGDFDGYGNACDGDLSQDGNQSLGDDFSMMFPPFGTLGGAADLDCDGAVLGTDFLRIWELWSIPLGG
jgi:hypothetical protein